MSESAIMASESANKGFEMGSSPQPPVSLTASAEKYQVDIELFSRISSELTKFVSELSEKIRGSAEQLKMIEQAVELKAGELKKLHEIDAATVTLEQLIEDQQQQKDQFEQFAANQRSLWDEEKSRRLQENQEYMERLQLQRQREEEEYRLRWTDEQLKAKQALTEELQEVQKRIQSNQEALEKKLLARELLLKEKELEWMQLVQELEQFMSKLGKNYPQTGS